MRASVLAAAATLAGPLLLEDSPTVLAQVDRAPLSKEVESHSQQLDDGTLRWTTSTRFPENGDSSHLQGILDEVTIDHSGIQGDAPLKTAQALVKFDTLMATRHYGTKLPSNPLTTVRLKHLAADRLRRNADGVPSSHQGSSGLESYRSIPSEGERQANWVDIYLAPTTPYKKIDLLADRNVVYKVLGVPMKSTENGLDSTLSREFRPSPNFLTDSDRRTAQAHLRAASKGQSAYPPNNLNFDLLAKVVHSLKESNSAQVYWGLVEILRSDQLALLNQRVAFYTKPVEQLQEKIGALAEANGMNNPDVLGLFGPTLIDEVNAIGTWDLGRGAELTIPLSKPGAKVLERELNVTRERPLTPTLRELGKNRPELLQLVNKLIDFSATDSVQVPYDPAGVRDAALFATTLLR